MAEEGATHYTESSSYSSSSVLSIIYFIIFGIILNPIVIIIFISIFAFSCSTPSFNFGPKERVSQKMYLTLEIYLVKKICIKPIT